MKKNAANASILDMDPGDVTAEIAEIAENHTKSTLRKSRPSHNRPYVSDSIPKPGRLNAIHQKAAST
jgi:hypothetical protein